MSRLKEKDKLTERVAGLSGRERRTREAAIYASQKSPTKRTRPLEAKNYEKRRTKRKRRTRGRREIELTAYHTARAKSIGGKLL